MILRLVESTPAPVVFVVVASLAACVSGVSFRGWQHACALGLIAIEESYRE